MVCKKCIKHQCAHYKVTFREYSGEVQPRQVEGCVFHLIYEELVNQSNRSAMIHKEMGETKNASLFLTLALLGDKQSGNELQKILVKNLGVPNEDIRKIPGPNS